MSAARGVTVAVAPEVATRIRAWQQRLNGIMRVVSEFEALQAASPDWQLRRADAKRRALHNIAGNWCRYLASEIWDAAPKDTRVTEYVSAYKALQGVVNALDDQNYHLAAQGVLRALQAVKVIGRLGRVAPWRPGEEV